ncbi:MAG TPA: hypothetical protein EYQ63_21450 [Fuerstia sp.]|nr:hypothetical protein [Fuerstiella sp.]
MKLFWRKQPAPKPAPLPEPTVDEAAERDAVRAEFAAELARFTDIFGVERGTRFVIDGVPMVAALMAEMEHLRGVLAIRDAQIDEQHERLWALDPDD